MTPPSPPAREGRHAQSGLRLNVELGAGTRESIGLSDFAKVPGSVDRQCMLGASGGHAPKLGRLNEVGVRARGVLIDAS